MRVQQPAFIHVEDGIRLVDLKNEDEKYLKQNGFSKLPSCIQGVEFSCLGKYYQGFGFRNDIGGVEFFHQLYTPFPIRRQRSIRHAACFMILWIIWHSIP